MQKIRLFKILLILLGLITFQSCTDYGYVEDTAFIGTWELKGRKIYTGMKVRIEKENGKLKGYIISPPDSNYGEIFIENGKTWITKIDRGANYYFKITENKIAGELFSQYDIKANSSFYATFSEEKDKIYLVEKRPNKLIDVSDIYYERIK
ncbi:hypothetical protein [Mariniphaga sediminis]|uniref:hypothetical protein n=1 Tax=Mariniphaga sediminis TaxID=1628158 RepID=UPI003569267E